MTPEDEDEMVDRLELAATETVETIDDLITQNTDLKHALATVTYMHGRLEDGFMVLDLDNLARYQSLTQGDVEKVHLRRWMDPPKAQIRVPVR